MPYIYNKTSSKFLIIVSIFILISVDLSSTIPSLQAATEKKGKDLLSAENTIIGERAGDWAGRTVKIIKDVNGDGLDDILISAPASPGSHSELGAVYLIFGQDHNFPSRLNLKDANASFLGDNDYAHAGLLMTGNGDYNGDGLYDIAIFEEFFDKDLGPIGKVCIFFGKRTGWAQNLTLSQADASYIGGVEDVIVGVETSGDVNNDGFDDLLVLQRRNNDYSGNNTCKVFLMFGKAAGWTLNATLGSADVTIGREVDYEYPYIEGAGLGDVNHDGFDDFIIAIYPITGSSKSPDNNTFLFFGKGTGWEKNMEMTSADVMFIENGSAYHFYYSILVERAGDVNNDGFDDILIAPHSSWGPGFLYIVLGKSKGWNKIENLSLGQIKVRVGWISSISGGGDVNKDGFDDILVGLPSSEVGPTPEKIYLILGRRSNWAQVQNLSCSDAMYYNDVQDTYGVSVSIEGDLNGDGYDDMLISSPFSPGSSHKSQIFLLYGEARTTASSQDYLLVLVLLFLLLVCGSVLLALGLRKR
jgi:hypothetical protein